MREMKNSGIEWIGAIPKDWSIIKLKFVAELITGHTPSTKDSNNFDGEINWYTPSDFIDYRIGKSERTISDYAVKGDKIKLFPKNSTLLVGIGATAGKVAIIENAGYSNQQITAIIGKDCNSEYLFYVMLMARTTLEKNALYTTLPIINNSYLGTLVIPNVPNKIEQKQIADYLDKKCAEIDGVIKGKDDENKALEEYRKSVIYEAVTKGLNPDAEMKDSGIEWIGAIPKDWEIWKLKHVTQDRNDKYSGENFSYIAMENIESCTCKLLETQSEYDLTSAIVAQKDDVIFGKLRPYLAKVYRITLPSLVNSEFVVLNPIKILSTYLKYYLVNPSFINYINSSTYGTKMPRASVEFILDSPIPVCNIKEQQQIAEYLDKKCEEIDNLIKGNNDLIDHLKEYKKSLIYEAVTGKIENA